MFLLACMLIILGSYIILAISRVDSLLLSYNHNRTRFNHQSLFAFNWIYLNNSGSNLLDHFCYNITWAIDNIQRVFNIMLMQQYILIVLPCILYHSLLWVYPVQVRMTTTLVSLYTLYSLSESILNVMLVQLPGYSTHYEILHVYTCTSIAFNIIL